MSAAATELPTPSTDDAESWVASHLGDLFDGEVRRGFTRGGQTAADAALASLEVAGYARRRSTVHPPSARGATKMSPFIRHGLLRLDEVHDHPSVRDAPGRDRSSYRTELLWQEYARHWYAVFGTATRNEVAHRCTPASVADDASPGWDRSMRCMDAVVDELTVDGWLVNQARMWAASQWAIRTGRDWQDGEDEMFRHLLDGSRAANRLGWQWTVGATRGRPYGFARAQVEQRAPALCRACSRRDACPIERFPDDVELETRPAPELAGGDVFGPDEVPDATVDAVWLTAESLGDRDPAAAAAPDAPVHFVVDEPLLRRLRLDAKRLVFLADSLADLAERRTLHVWRGRPAQVVGDLGTVAVTHAPVPGFRRIVARVRAVEHPWPWLRPPTAQLRTRVAKLAVQRSDGRANRFPGFRRWCEMTAPTR